MSDEIFELKKRMSKMSDEDLIDMVTVSAGDYRQEALDYAREELKYRRVEIPVDPEQQPSGDSNSADTAAQPDKSESAADSETTCPGCGGRLRHGTLVAEKELTIIFADNQEERFVRVTACTRCRQLWPAVDFETVVDH